MSHDEYLKMLKKSAEEIRNDPVRLHNLMKSIGALDIHRKIEGTEREHLVTLFQMMEPVESTNNQHCCTDEYRIGERVYHVHYFDGDVDALIEEYIKYKDPV